MSAKVPEQELALWDWIEDPFGPDQEIEDSPDTPKGFGKVSGLGKGNFKAREHYPRAKKVLNELHPGMYWTCDRQVPTVYGAMVSQDLLGFMDIEGISPVDLGDGCVIGRHVCCNVTTIGSIGAHVRHYCHPDNTYGQGKERVVDLLSEYLALGGTFYILGAYKDGRYWKYKVLSVTPDLIELTNKRRKKPA